MKMGEFLESLKEMKSGAESLSLTHSSRIVILSDLHLGDGTSRDDFLRNESAVLDVLRRWYLPKDALLVLNGDIEDLQKAKLQKILAGHAEFFQVLDDFAAKGRLRKIIGNHDLALMLEKKLAYPVAHALSLEWRGKSFLVYHGHQASTFFVKHNYISNFVVRYIAHPLRIKNPEVPMTSKRRFRAERRIYRASRKLGIVSITGHTHRPLFESLSKYDDLRYRTEELIRRYSNSREEEKPAIAELVRMYAKELRRLVKRNGGKRPRPLYGSGEVLAPCLFNSGCAVGKRGFTALEIEAGAISLVYWADGREIRPYVEMEAQSRDALEGTPWVRFTLNRDMLDHVVARTELLG